MEPETRIFKRKIYLEVKSSGYKTHKSLDEFCKKFSELINING